MVRSDRVVRMRLIFFFYFYFYIFLYENEWVKSTATIIPATLYRPASAEQLISRVPRPAYRDDLSDSFRLRFTTLLAPCLSTPWPRPHTSPRRHVPHGEFCAQFDAQRLRPWSDSGPEAAASKLSRRQRGKRRTRPLVQPRRKSPRKSRHRWQGPDTAPKRQTTAADRRLQYAYTCP